MTKIAQATALCILLLVCGRASAALVPTNPTCTNGNALTVMNPDASACIGSFQGSDAAQQADVLDAMTAGFAAQVGNGTWAVLETVAAGTSGLYLQTVPNSMIGTIELVSPMSGPFGLALGMPHQFSVYLFDGSASPVSDVYFTTAGTELSLSQVPEGLAHASLYQFSPKGPDPSEIPVPPGLLLMVTSLLLTGAVLRYRRSAPEALVTSA
jgi:hypothetical protein